MKRSPFRALAARNDAGAKCLLEAIAEVATAVRLVADADERTADVFHAAGFEAKSNGSQGTRFVRALTEAPAPADSVRALSLDDLETAIRGAWGRETSDDPDEWSEANPPRGQCAVTALLLRAGVRVERHAWNRLPSG